MPFAHTVGAKCLHGDWWGYKLILVKTCLCRRPAHSQLQISGEKWRRKSRRSSSSMKSWRRLVRLQLSLFRQGEACPLWSFSFRPHLQQHLHLQHRLQPCSQLLVSVADTAVLEHEPVATSGQLPTKLPWQRQPPPPVLRWIVHPLALFTFFLHHLLNLGGVKWRS